jgi:hypothetical protein
VTPKGLAASDIVGAVVSSGGNVVALNNWTYSGCVLLPPPPPVTVTDLITPGPALMTPAPTTPELLITIVWVFIGGGVGVGVGVGVGGGAPNRHDAVSTKLAITVLVLFIGFFRLYTLVIRGMVIVNLSIYSVLRKLTTNISEKS